jgi:subtilisin family serine protease/N-acetylneuraminic acid mutarotase
MSVCRQVHLRRRTRRAIRTGLCGLASIALLAGLPAMATPGMASASAVATGSSGGGARIEPALLNKFDRTQTTDFWVYFSKDADLKAASGIADRAKQGRFVYDQLTETANRSQAGVRAMLKDKSVKYHSFWIANTIRVTGDEDLMRRIAARPEVEQITADKTYRIPKPIPSTDANNLSSVEWGIDRIHAPQVWNQFNDRGEGIVVGSIDTGVLYTHPALVNQYRGNLGGGVFDHNYNWWDPSNVCDSPSFKPCDNIGHGTHTMGTMVGDDGQGNQVGVAPKGQWMTAKGCEGDNCSEFALLSSGQFMLAPTDLHGNNPDPSKRPDVINNSWGAPGDADPWFQPTVDAWVAAGIFPQFSAGNSQGTAACGSAGNPGNLPEAYAAGAIDVNDNLAAFSNRGPSAFGDGVIKPDIAAPGVAVRSAWNDGGYNTISGTSMASPHVAGTVALLWSASPALERDVASTRQLLDQSAIDTPDLTCGGTADDNNMYGEGRLDALAAVEQSPRGPVGTLTGKVTDAASGDTIGGARITVAGAVSRNVITGADGTYSTRLAAGDYTLTASAFDHTDQTAQVTVIDNQTTVRDFALVSGPSVTVTGQVTDGSGHGWPMYAKVSVQGTPRSTYTDPVTGRYQLELPPDGTFTVAFDPQYPGYAATTKTLHVGSADAVLDAPLTVNNCETAPGYHRVQVGILGDVGIGLVDFLNERGIAVEDYTLNEDPADFDVIVVNEPGDIGPDFTHQLIEKTDAAGTGVVWLDTWSDGHSGDGATGGWLLWKYTGNPSSRENGLSDTNPYIYYRVTQPHPVLAGFDVGRKVVVDNTTTWKNHSWFDGYQGDGRTVIANAGRADKGDLGPGIGVQQRANNRHVLLSLNASDTFSGPFSWTPDAGQILVNSLEWSTPDASLNCQPVGGGLVVGNVTDANTGARVEPATVTDVDDPADRGTGSASIDDPAHGGGFYWRFEPDVGKHTFRATARNYGNKAATVDIAADSVREADFALPAGRLDVTPSALDANLQIGRSSVQRTFTVANTGTAPANVRLIERRGSVEILGVNRAPAQVRNVSGQLSPAAPTADDFPDSAATASAEPDAAPWMAIPNYPQPIMDNSAALVDDVVYSFGGFNGSTPIADAYSFNPEAGQWHTISPLPVARIKAEAAESGGLIYVLGGWDSQGVAQRTVFAYNPDTNSYHRVADLPDTRAAAAVAVLDGKIYVVGGCIDTFCETSSTAWRYDPASDAWQSLADYPESAAWLGCAGVSGQIYCTGGVDSHTAFASTSTYAYDPASNTWTKRADLPYDNWAMAYTAANGQFVVSGGATNGQSTTTNRGAAYDPGADIWTEIEPSGQVTYRGAGACGFYKIGGATIGANVTSTVSLHPDFRDCPAKVDLPWLSATPATMTLQPGQRATVTVQITGSMDQPGTYDTGFSIQHDTPYAVHPVHLTATVSPPKTWGKVSGTVTSIDCEGNESPLPGATVRINGRDDGVMRFTDVAGGYGYWLSTANNPVQVIVSAKGLVEQSRTVVIKPSQTVAEDFALQQDCGAG